MTNQNVADVVNYIKAAEFAIERMNTLPLCNRLIKESAVESVDTIKKLSVLHDVNVEKIAAMGRSAKNVRAVFDYLEQNPIIDIGKTVKELNLAFSTVSLAVNKLYLVHSYI